MLPLIARLLVPVLVLTAAPAAQAAWLPPLKPSKAKAKRANPKAVAAAAGPAARPTPKPTPRPTPTPVPPAPLTPVLEEDLADPTPEVVHPAVRVDAWRATRTGQAYNQIFELDGSLWQGPWGLGARVLGVQDASALGALGAAGVPVAATLRRRFGEGPGPILTAEAGWHSGLGPLGLGLLGLQGAFPARWLVVEGAVRTAGFSTTDAWLVDAQLGFAGHLGPVGVGLGWRHMAFGRSARVTTADQLTGPYVSGRLGF